MKNKSMIKDHSLCSYSRFGTVQEWSKEKGAIFLTIFGLFCLESAFFGINALQELITLGSEPGIDNSMFLMVRGTLQLLITLIFVGFMFPKFAMRSRSTKIKL